MRYGGTQGVRDQGLLEAAALWESLSQNHPFIDGNKRAAFAATYTFLAINGMRLSADSEETCIFLVDVHETNQLSFDKLVPWLGSLVSPDLHSSRLR